MNRSTQTRPEPRRIPILWIHHAWVVNLTPSAPGIQTGESLDSDDADCFLRFSRAAAQPRIPQTITKLWRTPPCPNRRLDAVRQLFN